MDILYAFTAWRVGRFLDKIIKSNVARIDIHLANRQAMSWITDYSIIYMAYRQDGSKIDQYEENLFSDSGPSQNRRPYSQVEGVEHRLNIYNPYFPLTRHVFTALERVVGLRELSGVLGKKIEFRIILDAAPSVLLSENFMREVRRVGSGYIQNFSDLPLPKRYRRLVEGAEEEEEDS